MSTAVIENVTVLATVDTNSIVGASIQQNIINAVASTQTAVAATVQGSSALLLQIAELKTLTKSNRTSYYTEITRDIYGYPTTIDKWTDLGKGTKLFTKVITWTGDNATKTVTTDESTGKILTVDITYDIDDNPETILEVLT